METRKLTDWRGPSHNEKDVADNLEAEIQANIVWVSAKEYEEAAGEKPTQKFTVTIIVEKTDD